MPSGDWFCHKCTLEKKKEAERAIPESPPKKRPIFRDEEMEEEEETSENSKSEDSIDETGEEDEEM